MQPDHMHTTNTRDESFSDREATFQLLSGMIRSTDETNWRTQQWGYPTRNERPITIWCAMLLDEAITLGIERQPVLGNYLSRLAAMAVDTCPSATSKRSEMQAGMEDMRKEAVR